MNKASFSLLLIFLSAILSLPDMSLADSKPLMQEEPSMQIASSNNNFAFDLYNKLSEEKNNVFFSPYSISSALSMTLAGAKENTSLEISKALHIKTNEDSLYNSIKSFNDSLLSATKNTDIKLNTANSLWIDFSFNFLSEYLELVETYFDAELKEVDFKNQTDKSRMQINRWVEEKTNNKIQDLLKAGVVKADTSLILVNAIYFFGQWQEPFSKNSTKEKDFNLSDDSSVKSMFMHKLDSFPYMENSKLQMIEIPYQKNKLVMDIVLPKNNKDLNQDSFISEKTLNEQLSELKGTRVSLAMPKFKTESTFTLPQALTSLGIKDAFNQSKADFSGISGGRDFFIGNVIHKAFVEVDEVGTEAAAATAITMRATGILNPDPPKDFFANKPFIFFIREPGSGLILFMGRINNPTL